MPVDDASLHAAVRSLALIARRLERACAPLSLAQYRVLAMVDAGDERTSHLADRLAVAKPTVSAVVDGLVERGHLVREPVAGDRRSIRLCVTDAGRAAVNDAEVAMARSFEHLFAAVSDRDALLRGLAEMQDAWIARVGAHIEAARQ